MANPMLQMLSQTNPTQANNTSMLNKLVSIKQMLTGKNPQAIYDQMIRTNPQFAQFVNANKNKSVEQIAQEYGVDLNTLRSLFE